MVAVRKWREVEAWEELAVNPLLEVSTLSERLSERLTPAWEKLEILSALGERGGPEAVQVLRQYLAEPDPGLEDAAQLALERGLRGGDCDRNSPCGCGSGAKWKHCCAKERFDWSKTRRTRRADISAPWRSR